MSFYYDWETTLCPTQYSNFHSDAPIYFRKNLWSLYIHQCHYHKQSHSCLYYPFCYYFMNNNFEFVWIKKILSKKQSEELELIVDISFRSICHRFKEFRTNTYTNTKRWIMLEKHRVRSYVYCYCIRMIWHFDVSANQTFHLFNT